MVRILSAAVCDADHARETPQIFFPRASAKHLDVLSVVNRIDEVLENRLSAS